MADKSQMKKLNLVPGRESPAERERTSDLMRLLPRGRRSVLDVGARDGYFTQLLTEYFAEVTGLDLEKPEFELPNVITVAGDATSLAFPDNSFDCVFCTEVIEHIPNVEQACRELARVARYEVLIGVPYKQDNRVDRTTCRTCGWPNPPYGHVNTFDEEYLRELFPSLRLVATSFVGTTSEATNFLATFFMDLAENPWGSYNQDEPCIYCGARLIPPGNRPIWKKACSKFAASLQRMQGRWAEPHPCWIHVLLSKQEN